MSFKMISAAREIQTDKLLWGFRERYFPILEWRVMLKSSTIVHVLLLLLKTLAGTSSSLLSVQVILFLIMLVMRKRVALTIALFHVAGKVFIHLPLLVFQPFWTFFALVLFWVYWIMTLLFLGTTGKKTCCFFPLVMDLICIKIFWNIREVIILKICVA